MPASPRRRAQFTPHREGLLRLLLHLTLPGSTREIDASLLHYATCLAQAQLHARHHEARSCPHARPREYLPPQTDSLPHALRAPREKNRSIRHTRCADRVPSMSLADQLARRCGNRSQPPAPPSRLRSPPPHSPTPASAAAPRSDARARPTSPSVRLGQLGRRRTPPPATTRPRAAPSPPPPGIAPYLSNTRCNPAVCSAGARPSARIRRTRSLGRRRRTPPPATTRPRAPSRRPQALRPPGARARKLTRCPT